MKDHEQAKKVADALEGLRFGIDEFANALNDLDQDQDLGKKAFAAVNEARISEILTELYDEFHSARYKKLHNDLAEARFNL